MIAGRVYVLLLAVVYSAVAYDFQDAAYNDLLLKQMEELEDSLTQRTSISHNLRRVRRDDNADMEAVCRKWKDSQKFCCASDQFQGVIEADKDIKQQCFVELMGSDTPVPGFLGGPDSPPSMRGPPPPFPGQMPPPNSNQFPPPPPNDQFNPSRANSLRNNITCIFECVAQKKGMLDSQGEIVDTGIYNWASDSFPLDWQQALLPTVVPKCITEANDPNIPLKPSCSGGGGHGHRHGHGHDHGHGHRHGGHGGWGGPPPNWGRPDAPPSGGPWVRSNTPASGDTGSLAGPSMSPNDLNSEGNGRRVRRASIPPSNGDNAIQPLTGGVKIMKLGFCMFREIQLNCPSDQITNQHQCDKLQAMQNIPVQTPPVL